MKKRIVSDRKSPIPALFGGLAPRGAGLARRVHVFGVILLLAMLLSPSGVRSQTIEWTKYDNTTPANADSGVASTNGKIPLGSNGKGDDYFTLSPSVLKEGSNYKMWYTGVSGANYRIYHATSSNGLEWTKLDNTIPPDSDTTNSNSRVGLGTAGKGDNVEARSSAVILVGERDYKMWYSGYDGTNLRIYHVTFQIPPQAGTIFTFN